VNDLVERDPERERDDDEDLPDEPVAFGLAQAVFCLAPLFSLLLFPKIFGDGRRPAPRARASTMSGAIGRCGKRCSACPRSIATC